MFEKFKVIIVNAGIKNISKFLHYNAQVYALIVLFLLFTHHLI